MLVESQALTAHSGVKRHSRGWRLSVHASWNGDRGVRKWGSVFVLAAVFHSSKTHSSSTDHFLLLPLIKWLNSGSAVNNITISAVTRLFVNVVELIQLLEVSYNRK